MRDTALLHLIDQHGYFGLYLSLALGILGIPVPDETLLTFSGYLVFRNKLHLLPAVVVSILGSLTGMSLSYWIGRLIGLPFILRYGRYLHITPERFAKGKVLFHKFGRKSIVFGYFVPGFRHLTAYVSGISKLDFGEFISVSALGASGWVLLFITLGRIIGKDWALIGRLAHRYIGLLFVIAAIIVVILVQMRRESRARG